MNPLKNTLLWSSLLTATLALTGCSTNTACCSKDAAQYTYSTPIAPGVAVPDKVESSIGTLNLSTATDAEPSRKSTTTSTVRAPCRRTSGDPDREPGRHARFDPQIRTG